MLKHGKNIRMNELTYNIDMPHLPTPQRGTDSLVPKERTNQRTIKRTIVQLNYVPSWAGSNRTTTRSSATDGGGGALDGV